MKETERRIKKNCKEEARKERKEERKKGKQGKQRKLIGRRKRKEKTGKS